MSFGRTLKRIKEGVEDPMKKSVVHEIDKQCLNIISYFNTGDIIVKLKDLLKLIKRPGKFDRDKFFKLFFELYEVVYAPDARGVGCFHASSLEDDCERRLFFEIKGEPISDKGVRKEIGPQLQRIFDVGTWWHTYIQYQLYKAGILEQAEVPVKDAKKKIDSRADGILNISGRRILLEIKSMNSRSYAKNAYRPNDKHVYQASLYAKELELEEICFIYVNKDTSEMKEYIIPVDEKILREPYRKMKRVLMAVEADEKPERICRNKFSEIALNCGYCSLCFSTIK